ncbi:MAG: hypothetical protein A3J65_00100 [Candidatus Buchananbacteria bacterium RIFCSPHIGHO2_02_FULL_45_11b]|uniref:Pilus assembly protein PilO n=3 Tax=Candidatus Buchananiibacteriota TaxID=1817903 RepID=A0A1G1Y534_9BACT|nr:MAG: hypothetical protein A2663_04220 [Candidatus Buchananbacteria bacterium RIFCSPHIGHO2_01_FULL_46_12]OGY50335.1 MAG: hypothetical protein A3J65_00100 [Candidatus Buchananbacteria bacterium RIFCSPHIGHO2_02_FULL_45_11b]OGY57467.1 MAG: hypothetical protein A3H67_02330 [Candidatus Buchananbacteria bacterium RIFCSPLOWO2_02_FULL_46_11b]
MAKPLSQPTKEKIDLKVLFSRFYLTITAVLIAVILASGGYFFLWPKYQEVRANSSRVYEALLKEEAKRADYEKTLKDLIAGYKKINKQEINKLKILLPAGKDFSGLFAQLQGLAEENNFLLSGLTISELPDAAAAAAEQKKPASSAVKKLSISVNLMGGKTTGYENLKSFLSSLEQNLRLFDVEAVYFTPQSSKYSLTLLTYYLPE